MVGSPISHSLSPLLHGAAYAALGLDGWTFTAQEVPAGGLRSYVEQLGPGWVGLAVTMPLKEEALALGTEVGPAARLAGAANTLVRRDGGWLADNTDVHGVVQALTEAGALAPRSATVLGGGATARSTLVALSELGVQEVTFRVRGDLRPGTAALAGQLGLRTRVVPLLTDPLVLDGAESQVVVSTLPPTAEPGPVLAPPDAVTPVVMDVVYRPWPSRFATAVREAAGGEGLPVARGTGMLLHQAVRQVELMTGHNGPVAAMRAALDGTGSQ
ncbi:shikimate dehydrogenase [Ornithinimicrobium humiphilum]|uniref:Shikimate dehydrogenase n=1 Tax=Ornithinimicrobium humiphilum TaxID=125288 RepID=A0A543KPP7_9MICO|nr:shikimate dehydrogenase [Ornithinimicrobium humiphilum]